MRDKRVRAVAGRQLRRLRAGWEAVQPVPAVRYRHATPTTASGEPLNFFLPPTIQTLAAAATSEEAAQATLRIFDLLSPNDFHRGQQIFMQWGRSIYGAHWRLANLITTLWAAATLVRVQTYLEIGVYRGRSAAIVGAVRPECAIYGFDLWIEDYAGAANPGPEFVRDELRSAGHTGEVTLISGNSRETLPAFLRAQPDVYFDLITIDGDKSLGGVASDFVHALPRLKAGGIVVFDDMPIKPVLRRVWNRAIRDDRRYAQWEFDCGDHGVAAAIRLPDQTA